MAAITLTSLNAHAGCDPDGAPFDLEAACLRLGGEVVAVQEAWHADGRPDPLAAAAERMGATLLRADLLAGLDLRALRIADDPSPGQWGLALLTTLPVTGYEVAPLGQARGDLAPRAAQLVTVAMPDGGRLRVANAHLTHRLVSPAQLLSLVRRLTLAATPTVIAGDLNMPAPVAGLAAGYSPAVSGRTYPARRPVVQLDHILAGRGVAATDGRVLPALGSDHLAIRARLRLR